MMEEVKKKARKKKVKKEIVESSEKILTKEELLQLQVSHSEQATINLTMEIMNRDIKILGMQKELLNQQVRIVEFEIAEKNRKLNDAKTNRNNKIECNRKFMEDLKSKYDISGSFGYDPETGILRED